MAGELGILRIQSDGLVCKRLKQDGESDGRVLVNSIVRVELIRGENMRLTIYFEGALRRWVHIS